MKMLYRGGFFAVLILLFVWMAAPAAGYGQEIRGQVVDETGIAVGGAKVSLTGGTLKAPVSVVSDQAGRFLLPPVPDGAYDLQAEKPGYYATISRSLPIKAGGAPLEVVLNHLQEFEETVNVVYSAPVIDRQEAAAKTELTAAEVTDLPFVATHDFRNALPLVPGIIKDNNGRIHMNGGGEDQAFYSLDGFNVTSPVSGVLENRISVDSIRALHLETSRYSAEYGKGSAGVMALESSQGDDRFRFSSTNFVPSFEVNHGLVLSNWNPRATVSGPIAKGRAWYFNAVDLQYDLNTVHELPPGADTSTNWIGSNMTRVQVNLTGKNLLTGGLLFNFRDSSRVGISPLDPVETSRDLYERFYFFNMKDQAYLSGGWIVETGIAANQLNRRQFPQGDATYVLSPEGRSGNYFMTSKGETGRIQMLASVQPPLWNWHGRHSFKFGVDADRIRYRQYVQRNAIEVRAASGEISREVAFLGGSNFGINNFEFGGYVQDRWTANDHVFVEAGIRFDWDQVVGRRLWSPRLAMTWIPARLPDSKFSAGIGVFHDATNLELLTRALDQEREDTFYGDLTVPGLGAPVITRFLAQPRDLEAPRYLNWSLGWQQKLGGGFYLDSNFIRKTGSRVWAYDLQAAAGPSSTEYSYRLGDSRRDSYYYVEAALSRTFKGKYPWLLSYARSRTSASQVIDFSIDNPVFGRQAPGPFDWDTPNRLISWGVLPIPHFPKYSLAYFAEWHSGLPWTVVNGFQQRVGAPNSRRYPGFFSINLHAERQFHFWHSQWALRVGFNNLTGHQNPTVVNNNLDAVDFGSYSGSQGRVFTGRIRFLGKN